MDGDRQTQRDIALETVLNLQIDSPALLGIFRSEFILANCDIIKLYISIQQSGQAHPVKTSVTTHSPKLLPKLHHQKLIGRSPPERPHLQPPFVYIQAPQPDKESASYLASVINIKHT